jgi:hypothetical protein
MKLSINIKYDSKKPKMNSSHRPPDEFKYQYSHIEGAPGHSLFSYGFLHMPPPSLPFPYTRQPNA